MAIDWKSLGHHPRIVFLVRMTYRPSGGGGDETLYLCHRSGQSEEGFYDHENVRPYFPYVVGIDTDERWCAIEAIPRVVPERLDLTLALPTDASSDYFAAVLQGTFKRRDIVVEAVQVDSEGMVLAREEIWRGVGADRGSRRLRRTGANQVGRVPTVTVRAEGLQGIMHLPVPLDRWIITGDKGAYEGQEEFDGYPIPWVYCESWNVDIAPTADTAGGAWRMVPILDSSASSVQIGICGHDIDENPNSAGEWLTGGSLSGIAQIADSTVSGWFVGGWGSWSVTSTWPKLVTTYSEFGSNAMVVDLTIGSATSTKEKKVLVNTHGIGSESGKANAIVKAELVLEDFLTRCGASGFWYTGWPTALTDEISDANREVAMVIPGVELTNEVPTAGEVVGEILGLYGLNFIWAPDSSNDDELRYKLAWRKTPSAPYDHEVTVAAGVVFSLEVDLAESDEATDVVIQSAPYFRDLWVREDGTLIRPTRQTYTNTDATAKAVDNQTSRQATEYQWLRAGDSINHWTAEARWQTVAAVMLDHTSARTQLVRGKFGPWGMALQRGDSVKWYDSPWLDYLDVEGGLVARRAVNVDRSGALTVEITTIHGPFTY